jgi:hypothetical protein
MDSDNDFDENSASDGNREFFFFHCLYSPLGPWPLIFRFHDHFTDGGTPWTSDKLVARPENHVVSSNCRTVITSYRQVENDFSSAHTHVTTGNGTMLL